MTFCPEWLTGSPNLDTSNPLYLWVYLVVRHIHDLRVIRISSISCAVHERHVSQFSPTSIENLLTEFDIDGSPFRSG
jgi:hypothetical protein